MLQWGVVEGCAEWQGTSLENWRVQTLVGSNPAPSASREATKVRSPRGRARRARESHLTGKIRGGGRLRSSSNRLFWRRKIILRHYFLRARFCALPAHYL